MIDYKDITENCDHKMCLVLELHGKIVKIQWCITCGAFAFEGPEQLKGAIHQTILRHSGGAKKRGNYYLPVFKRPIITVGAS